MKIIIISITFISIIFSQNRTNVNQYNTDLLNENPLYPIPEEMTFEESDSYIAKLFPEIS